MEQRSLRVAETNKTFFSKLTNTISKILVPTRIGFNGIIISIKRNAVIKAYTNYIEEQNKVNSEQKELLMQKYEDAYSLYLEIIDKNIMDSVYKKVKNGIATDFEREVLAKYYLVVSLKEKNYLEYKYKKQEYLLKIDYEIAQNIKKEATLKKYKEFYVSKMDSLYKGLLKNYSIELSDNIKIQTNPEELYTKIFKTLEDYVTEILPIKILIDQDNKKLQEEYDKYENASIGKLNERDNIMKNVALIEISRSFFTHSLPLYATEKCYIRLTEQARELVLASSTKTNKDKAYITLIQVIENYNIKLLSTKIYWDNLEEKTEFKEFWNKFLELENIQDEKIKEKQKIILFLKRDVKQLYVNEKKNKNIIKIHKQYLVELGAIKQLKNKPSTSFINARIIRKKKFRV